MESGEREGRRKWKEKEKEDLKGCRRKREVRSDKLLERL